MGEKKHKKKKLNQVMQKHKTIMANKEIQLNDMKRKHATIIKEMQNSIDKASKAEQKNHCDFEQLIKKHKLELNSIKQQHACLIEKNKNLSVIKKCNEEKLNK